MKHQLNQRNQRGAEIENEKKKKKRQEKKKKPAKKTPQKAPNTQKFQNDEHFHFSTFSFWQVTYSLLKLPRHTQQNSNCKRTQNQKQKGNPKGDQNFQIDEQTH